MAAALLVASYSYSYCDIINGTTGNAAINGYQWNMLDVLPPQAGLTVGGLAYSYNVTKNTEDNFTVSIEGDHTGGGLAFQEIDDWSGLPGNTIAKAVPLNDIPIDVLGDARINTTGDGQVNDPTVRFFYRYDECFDPQTSPDCPGYINAYLDFLKENNLFDESKYINLLDDENVREVLERKVDLEEEDLKSEQEEDEEEEEKEDLEKMLAIGNEANELADTTAQQSMLEALARVDLINSYVTREIQGGVYNDTVVLQDNRIDDNRGAALRMGLASSQLHEEMVNSQYRGN